MLEVVDSAGELGAWSGGIEAISQRLTHTGTTHKTHYAIQQSKYDQTLKKIGAFPHTYERRYKAFYHTKYIWHSIDHYDDHYETGVTPSQFMNLISLRPCDWPISVKSPKSAKVGPRSASSQSDYEMTMTVSW
jgi:hypothetical protein